MEELTLKKKDLEELNPAKYKIEEEIERKQEELKKEEEVLKILEELQKEQSEASLEEEKINIHSKAKDELVKNKEELQEELKDIKQVKEKSKASLFLYFIPVLFIIASIILFVVLTPFFGAIGLCITILSFIIVLFKNLKENKEYEGERQRVREQRRDIESKIGVIDEEIKSKENLIKDIRQKLEFSLKLQKEQIQLKYPNASKILEYGRAGKENIQEEHSYINELKLSLSQKEFQKGQIMKELEGLVEIEENLDISKQLLAELEEYDSAINIAKEALDVAYLEMRENVTPRFAENLSRSVDSITSGKYKKVKVNEENGLSLEMENRKLYNSK